MLGRSEEHKVGEGSGVNTGIKSFCNSGEEGRGCFNVKM